MGSCCGTNPKIQEKEPINAIVSLNGENGNGNHLDKSNVKTNTTSYLNNVDLKVTAESFVRKKTGKITMDYKLLNPPLGKGGFGEVRKGIHKSSGITRAVKLIKKEELDEEEQETLINEDHPNVIKVFEFYEDEKLFYIVTELCTGGELFDRIIDEGRLSEKDAADLMKQILGAVLYCHGKKIAHRDLKPENILYETEKEDSIIKIIDFGTSKTFDPNEKMTAKFGTPYYIAPEVLKKKYDEKCDLWSCGVVLYIMLCGYPPFNGANDKEIMSAVEKGYYTFNGAEWDFVTDDAKRFIKRMLEMDVSKRYNASEALTDPWLKSTASNKQVSKPVAISALKNLKNFRANNKLQNAIFTFLVSSLATNEEKNQLLQTFKSLDLNGDGQLTRDELIIGYKKILKADDAEEEVNRIMASVDANGSGDGSGTITVDELKKIFMGGGSLDDASWKQIIQEVDQNGDGEISFKEFYDLMKKYI